MFGPYRLRCRDCDFSEEIADGWEAKRAADCHHDQTAHEVVLRDVSTTREYRAPLGFALPALGSEVVAQVIQAMPTVDCCVWHCVLHSLV